MGFGYPVNRNLPSIDETDFERPTEAIVRRQLCALVASACAFGFDRAKGIRWLEQEGIVGDLTANELRYIEQNAYSAQKLWDSVEAQWALCWALGIVEDLDFGQVCADDFVQKMPALKVLESSAIFRSRMNRRSREECYQQLDIAYCLHWASREARLHGLKHPNWVPPYVIAERRRALEWLYDDCDWDNPPMDT